MADRGDLNEVYQLKDLNIKRQKFLSYIPSEHQNYYRSGDRFITHNANIQSFNKIKDYDRMSFISEVASSVHVAVYTGDAPLDQYTRSCIHAYALSTFYDPDWDTETNPQLATTLGSLITILATYTPYNALLQTGLETLMGHCHLAINKTEWNTIDMVKEETQEFRDAVAESMRIGSFDDTPQACTVVALSLLILIGKNVTEANRAGWFRNRWRAIANIANVMIDENRIDPPLLTPCQAVYTSSSANQPIRSCLFKVMRTLAGITENQTHVIFDRIIHLLQWSEMSHIWMITQFIFGRGSAPLHHKCVRTRLCTDSGLRTPGAV